MNLVQPAAWLVTYALHSTLFALLAFIANAATRNEKWHDVAWKTALIGGLLTTTFAHINVADRFVQPWQVAALQRPAATETVSSSAPSEVAPAANIESAATSSEGNQRPTLIELAVMLWAVIAFALLLRLALHNVQLFRRLRSRKSLAVGALPGMLAQIRRQAGYWKPVRLSTSTTSSTPIALGRREICLPERFELDLDAEQQRAALAHELAHLVRRDPVWQLFAGIVEAVFFFQPLNRFARIRMRVAAEHLADDWAAEQSGSPLGLARCLVEIAEWVGDPIPSTTLAMAEDGSPLRHRVERLADWNPRRGRQWLRLIAAAGAVFWIAAAGPIVSAEQQELRAEPIVVVNDEPDSVIVWTAADRLGERWTSAQQHNLRAGVWIGWGFEPAQASDRVASDSKGLMQSANGRPLALVLARAQTTAPAAVIFGFPEPRTKSPTQARLRLAQHPLDLNSRPLVWLGNIDQAQSIAQLQQLYRSADVDLRKEIIAAITLHSDTRTVMSVVRELMGAEASAKVRAEVVQWLSRTHPRDASLIAYLLDLAFRDPAEEVQRESVDALRSLLKAGVTPARAALIRVAERHTDWDLKSEASQALAREQTNPRR